MGRHGTHYNQYSKIKQNKQNSKQKNKRRLLQKLSNNTQKRNSMQNASTGLIKNGEKTNTNQTR